MTISRQQGTANPIVKSTKVKTMRSHQDLKKPRRDGATLDMGNGSKWIAKRLVAPMVAS